MRTPKDFDYDIWKDTAGHYYIRIRRTGETARVSNDVVRELWRELHRMRKHQREATVTDKNGSRHARILPLYDKRSDDSESGYIPDESRLMSSEHPYENIETEMMEQDFLKTLTEKQRLIYRLYFKSGLTVPECAGQIGTSKSNIDKHLCRIRKKAKVFFADR